MPIVDPFEKKSGSIVDPFDGSDMSGTEKFLAGVGKGMTDIGTGAMQRVLEGGQFIRDVLGLESNQENIDKLKRIVEENRAAFKPLSETSTAANVGEFVGNVAPTVAIPGGVTGGVLKRIGTSALSGGATGALQPTAQDESALMNAALGAAGGGATSGLMSAVGKGINAIAGKTVPNAIEDLSKAKGIRTTLGESLQNPTIEKAETWLEGVPVIGLKGFREAQNKEAEQASKNFLAQYIVDPSAPDAMAVNRKYASDIFDKMKTEVSGISSQSIKPDNTRKAATELLDRYPDIFKKFQDSKREGIIASIVEDTKPTTKKSAILNAKGAPISTTVPKEITFEEAWALRDGLGEMIGQARKKLATGDVDKTTYSEISKLYSAINNDIDSWAGSVGRPDIRTMINEANDAYKQYVVKFDIIQRAFDKAEGTTGAGEIFSPKKFSTALKTIAYQDKALKKFSATEIDEMTGLANILQVVKRAGQFKENPPTGSRWGLPVLAAATFPMSAGAAAGEIGAVGVARFLTGTKLGKNVALAASKVEPDSRAMAALMNVVYNQAPKFAATEATSD